MTLSAIPLFIGLLVMLTVKEPKTRKKLDETKKAFSSQSAMRLRALSKKSIKEAEVSEEKAREIPIVKIVDTLLEYGYQNKASDIHIEPREDKIEVRFRIDGVLHDVVDLPKFVLDPVVTRIKILARLRTDEHRAAQDGKIHKKLSGEDIDIRVSIMPITDGEKVVMRILSVRGRGFSLEDLGLLEKDVKTVETNFKKPFGMILATGPTGSGKTTTLYAILKKLNTRRVNISTIEDPIEYDMEGINQIQVDPRTNLTFAEGLKSIMRQDPDIIMVGEIRDDETASIAVNAAMTGHLVLSSLHTNDAATTLPRLLDMGIEPYLVASTVNVAIAQRLVRKICMRCIESYTVKGKELEKIKQRIDLNKIMGKEVKEIRCYKGKGCQTCHQSGYSGRVGIFEVLEMEDSIRDLIMQKANSDQIKEQAVKNGMTTMIEDGVNKALMGITTIDEILRVIQ